jgi:hypothetical protein
MRKTKVLLDNGRWKRWNEKQKITAISLTRRSDAHMLVTADREELCRESIPATCFSFPSIGTQAFAIPISLAPGRLFSRRFQSFRSPAN